MSNKINTPESRLCAEDSPVALTSTTKTENTEPKTREKAVELINKQLDSNYPAYKPHYGREELRELMDFIYGGKPTCESEEIK